MTLLAFCFAKGICSLDNMGELRRFLIRALAVQAPNRNLSPMLRAFGVSALDSSTRLRHGGSREAISLFAAPSRLLPGIKVADATRKPRWSFFRFAECFA